MKKLFLSLALGLLFAFGVNAQNAKGNWYVGTGDIANVAWTDWAVSPTIGYAITDNIILGGSVSHVAGEDMDLNFNVKYLLQNKIKLKLLQEKTDLEFSKIINTFDFYILAC